MQSLTQAALEDAEDAVTKTLVALVISWKCYFLGLPWEMLLPVLTLGV